MQSANYLVRIIQYNVCSVHKYIMLKYLHVDDYVVDDYVACNNFTLEIPSASSSEICNNELWPNCLFCVYSDVCIC